MPETAPDVTLVLTKTLTALEDGDDRPCVYCNPDDLVAERIANAEAMHPEKDIPEEAGLVFADYVMEFGHREGAGVEVPVCDTCINGAPVEGGDQTVRDTFDLEYMGDGQVGKKVVETDDEGRTIHRRVPVNAD